MSEVTLSTSRGYQPLIIPYKILAHNPDEQDQSDFVRCLVNLPQELADEIAQQCSVGDRASLALSCKRLGYVLSESQIALPRPGLPRPLSWKNEKKTSLGELMRMLNMGMRTNLVDQLDAVHDEYLELARWHVSEEGKSTHQFLQMMRPKLKTGRTMCSICLDSCVPYEHCWVADDLWWKKYADTVVRNRLTPPPYRVDRLYERVVLGDSHVETMLCSECVCVVVLLGVDWEGPYV